MDSQQTPRAGDLKRELGAERYKRLRDESRRLVRRRGTPDILSAAERVALYHYTTDGQFVRDLNQALRDGDEGFIARNAEMVAFVTAALGKLPNYRGQVLRGIQRTGCDLDATLERYAEGSTVTESRLHQRHPQPRASRGVPQAQRPVRDTIPLRQGCGGLVRQPRRGGGAVQARHPVPRWRTKRGG